MSTLSMQFLTEAWMGTMGAHKGQNVPDPPHPNRICLKKDEDFRKTGVLFFFSFCKMCQRTHFSFPSPRGRVGTKAAAMTANVASVGSMKSRHCSL